MQVALHHEQVVHPGYHEGLVGYHLGHAVLQEQEDLEDAPLQVLVQQVLRAIVEVDGSSRR